MKSVVILKANPGILKHGGGIKMSMWLCIERRSYLGFGNRVRMRKIGRNIVRQKQDAKRVVYMAMDQNAQELVEKFDSFPDGRELCVELPNKVLQRRDMLLDLVVLKMKVG